MPAQPQKVGLESMRRWIGRTIAYMLEEGESDETIVRYCSVRNKEWAEVPEQISDAAIRQQIEMWRGEYQQESIDLTARQSWLVSARDFLKKEIEPREPLMIDAETGATVLYAKSLNQIFAYRGIGKSVVANALIKVLTQGGDFLRFRSDGGYRTLLVDGELPQVQLQERLKEFSGDSDLLRIISPELMPNPKEFPVLSDPAQQERFLAQIQEFAPDVLIFDTLTRIFKFDTNDPDAWSAVNDFLLELRFRGYCVVLIHHAGKNGTQRGRTDGDDNLDLTVQLEARYGWQPGDGLQFKWKYEKVRHGGHLPEFEAEYQSETRTWQVVQDDRTTDVIDLARQGKTQRGIALALEMSAATVNRILKRARQQGLIDLNEMHSG